MSRLDASTTQIVVKCPRCGNNVECILVDRWIDDIANSLQATYSGEHECAS